MRKTTLLMCAVLLSAISPLFIQISFAQGSGQLNLMDIPEYLGDKLGIGPFAGGLLATAILVMMIMLPSAMLIRGKHASLFMLIEGLCIYGFCTAIVWIPIWLMIVLCMLLALLFSGNVRDWLSGTGGKS